MTPTGAGEPATAAGAEAAPVSETGGRRKKQPRLTVPPFTRLDELPDPTPADGPDPYGNPDPEPAWMAIDWRDHLRAIDLGGTRVNYVEIGEGAPIVFVHGLGGCWQNWLENLPHFAARGHRAIALDLPGFGRSPLPDWPISIPAYGRLVDDFRRRLGVTEATLVGNSMGGFIAAEIATARPGWVRRLVLASPAGMSTARTRGESVAVATRISGVVAPLLLRLGNGGMRRAAIREALFRGVFRFPLEIRTELLWEFFNGGLGAPGFLSAATALVAYDFRDRIPQIEAPTLIAWGRNDLVVPSTDARAYGDRIPGSEVVILDRCGHVAMAERPVRFNRLMERLIAER